VSGNDRREAQDLCSRTAIKGNTGVKRARGRVENLMACLDAALGVCQQKKGASASSRIWKLVAATTIKLLCRSRLPRPLSFQPQSNISPTAALIGMSELLGLFAVDRDTISRILIITNSTVTRESPKWHMTS
jgi:hypothetical protein